MRLDFKVSTWAQGRRARLLASESKIHFLNWPWECGYAIRIFRLSRLRVRWMRPQRPQLLDSYGIVLTCALWTDIFFLLSSMLDPSTFLLHDAKYSHRKLESTGMTHIKIPYLATQINPTLTQVTYLVSWFLLDDKSPERWARVLVPFTQTYFHCHPDTVHGPGW